MLKRGSSPFFSISNLNDLGYIISEINHPIVVMANNNIQINFVQKNPRDIYTYTNTYRSKEYKAQCSYCYQIS